MPGHDKGDAPRGALRVMGLALLALASAWAGVASGGDGAARNETRTDRIASLLAAGRASVENVAFKNRALAVRVVRGAPLAVPAAPAVDSRDGDIQIVSFGPDGANRVKVVRGPAAAPPQLPSRSETVSFADPLLAPVTVVRGPRSALPVLPVDLFGPANRGELDRIAFAVDGIESRHGADLRMWRPGIEGPQGPMQVSAAAALDVGGGDRFDMQQNRLLGRAYLAQMYERYGNWRDALAAYNWGPGNLDQWIAQGRDPNRLAPGVSWYVNRVLHDALMSSVAGL